jgi:Sec-independent protein translocase protein TatA
MGFSEWLVIISIVFILSQAKKWGQLGRSFKESVLQFKKGLTESNRKEKDVTPE